LGRAMASENRVSDDGGDPNQRHAALVEEVTTLRSRVESLQQELGRFSDQRSSGQALLDGEARLRGVVDSAVDGIITINELGIIESINVAGVRTFGYSREELIGQNVKLLMPEPYLAEHDSYLANYRNTGKRKIIGIGREVMGRRKDGSTFPVDLAVSEVHLGDRRLFTGIVRDITERKEAERALVTAKEAAEAASRAKEHFLSVLSHELRTPLTPVLAEMSFIEDQADLPAELRSRLGMVRRNIETEARLVDDLLDLTRIGRGKIQLNCEVVDLHETARAAIGMFQNAIDAKLIEVSVALRAKDHHVQADPGRLQQVLLNLLSNAVKFTPKSGKISIQSANEQTDQIDLEISDNGAGIEPLLFARLFNAFEQSDQSRRLGGLGLGLSIAKSLTEMHQGTLVAFSDGHNKGSSFKLTLATVAPAREQPCPPAPAEVHKIDQRILLVEDHEDTRIVMARLLRSLGCEVTTAGSVAEALAAAEKESFDLLISDIGLPDGSGLDVMKNLKDRVERGIALSGFGQEEDLRRSREAGFHMHLIKPINFNMLKDVLRRVS
jgi:PAS domain S-box-containing protein